MTPTLIVAIAITGIVIGIAIGAVGIGGVLLVPFLTLTLGIDVKHAIAAALLSYLPSCVVAVTLYARRGSIPWREAGLALPRRPAHRLARRACRAACAGGAAGSRDRRAAAGRRHLRVAAAARHRRRGIAGWHRRRCSASVAAPASSPR